MVGFAQKLPHLSEQDQGTWLLFKGPISRTCSSGRSGVARAIRIESTFSPCQPTLQPIKWISRSKCPFYGRGVSDDLQDCRLCRPGQTNRKSVPQPSEGEVAVMLPAVRATSPLLRTSCCPSCFACTPRRGSSSTATACAAAAGHWARTSRFVSSLVPTGSIELLLLDELRQAIATPDLSPIATRRSGMPRRSPIRSTAVTSWPESRSCFRPGRVGEPGCSGQSV